MGKLGLIINKWYIVLMLSWCLLIPVCGSADDSTGYGALKLGYFMPNDDDDGLKDFDDVFSIGLAGGVKLTPNIAIEIGGDFYSTEVGDATVSFLNASYTVDVKVTTWSMPLTGKLILPVSEELDFFLGLGVGWFSSKIDMDGTGSIGGVSADIWHGSDSADGIGYHGVVGADYNIDPNIALGVEIKWCKAMLEFEDISDDETNVGGTTFNLVAKYLF